MAVILNGAIISFPHLHSPLKDSAMISGNFTQRDVQRLAKDLEARVTVAKINIDENPQTPGKYGVRGIPTLMIFKDGQVAATKIGALPKSKLYEWVESVV